MQRRGETVTIQYQTDLIRLGTPVAFALAFLWILYAFDPEIRKEHVSVWVPILISVSFIALGIILFMGGDK